jgi:bifunctional non-homologous end joining protein LigD
LGGPPAPIGDKSSTASATGKSFAITTKTFIQSTLSHLPISRRLRSRHSRALTHLRCRSCIIDGEAVICDDNGVTSFDHIRYRRNDGDVFLYAFDLIELNGDDLRRDPLDVRKATLRSVLTKVGHGIRWNEHIEGDGTTIFRHACKLGLEGIVSKRKNSPYRSGRSPDWLKMKNPDAPAVKREEEEDWGKGR